MHDLHYSESSLVDSSSYNHLQKAGSSSYGHLFVRPEGVRSQELPLYAKSSSGSVTSSLASTQGQNTQYKTIF